MELKNAVAICLITLFSATLVVLIARSLDSAAASRLEPQLARIAEELEALRATGGIEAASGSTRNASPPRAGLVVYFFHGNARCPTCWEIESQARDVVLADFAAQLDSGEIVWKTLNYEDSATSELATRFEIQMSVVVLARMKDGQIEDWNRLDQVWGLVGDKPAFAKFIRDAIRKMLSDPDLAPTDREPTSRGDDLPTIPIPGDETDELPLPTGPAEIPIP